MSGWVCVMYHEVLEELPRRGGRSEYFAVSRTAFEEQLEWIGQFGFRGCTIGDSLSNPQAARIAITFDDGTIGQARYAFPALLARQMSATFFVVTDWVGRPGFASWDDLREMQAAGMEISSHTRTHPFLSELGDDDVLAELRDSRRELDDRLGQVTTLVSLPNGDWPRRGARRLIAEAGYRVVASSGWGRNPSRPVAALRVVRRCTVRGRPDSAWFRKVLFADRWLAARRLTREAVLGALRSGVGPSRYSRWRRAMLSLARS